MLPLSVPCVWLLTHKRNAYQLCQEHPAQKDNTTMDIGTTFEEEEVKTDS